MVAVSILVHAGALGLAVARPAPTLMAPPQVISVEIVADPSKPAKPSAPRPSPPAPKVRKPAKTVLPAKPSEPKPAKPKPRPRREEVVLDPAPKQEKSLEDLLADFREEQGQPAPEPVPAPRQAAVTPSPGLQGGTGRVSPEVADWMRRAKIHVRRSWVVQAGFRTQDLSTHVVVELDREGNVVGTPEKVKRSGNPWYDDSVINGILKASPLPPPPEPGTWDFIFTPEDSL